MRRVVRGANGIYTEAKEDSLFKAEIISKTQNELMPKLAIVVDNKEICEDVLS